MNKNFALIGASGYIAPRHLQAIRDTDNNLTMTTIHIGNGATEKYFVFGSNNVGTPAIDLTGLSGVTLETSQGNAATSTTFSHLVRIVTHNNGYVVGKGGDGMIMVI